MENKLQTLTDKLYQEGVNKGKEEGEKILQQAKEQADSLLQSAKAQAGEVLDKARKEAEELKNNSLTEIKITSRQMLSTLKQEIETQLLNKTVSAGVALAMGDKEFIQSLILKAVESFKPEINTGLRLELLLPESDRNRLDTFISNHLAGCLDKGMEVKFDSDLEGGFAIANRSEGYMLSFTDKDFMALFAQYARPKIKELLF